MHLLKTSCNVIFAQPGKLLNAVLFLVSQFFNHLTHNTQLICECCFEDLKVLVHSQYVPEGRKSCRYIIIVNLFVMVIMVRNTIQFCPVIVAFNYKWWSLSNTLSKISFLIKNHWNSQSCFLFVSVQNIYACVLYLNPKVENLRVQVHQGCQVVGISLILVMFRGIYNLELISTQVSLSLPEELWLIFLVPGSMNKGLKSTCLANHSRLKFLMLVSIEVICNWLTFSIMYFLSVPSSSFLPPSLSFLDVYQALQKVLEMPYHQDLLF